MRGLSVRLRPLALPRRPGFIRLNPRLFVDHCQAAGPDSRSEISKMSPVAEFDLRQTVISNSTFGPIEIKQIAQAISSDYNNFRTLRDATNELAQQSARTPAASARLGVCQYLIGRYGDAVQTLTSADGGALTHFYLGKSYLAL